MLSQTSLAFLLGVAALTNAQSCGGSGVFDVADVSGPVTNGPTTLGPKSVQELLEVSAQICIVNRSPNVVVTISADQVNNAIAAVVNTCCKGRTTCSGGQQKITSSSGNVIDLSVQKFLNGCTA